MIVLCSSLTVMDPLNFNSIIEIGSFPRSKPLPTEIISSFDQFSYPEMSKKLLSFLEDHLSKYGMSNID